MQIVSSCGSLADRQFLISYEFGVPTGIEFIRTPKYDGMPHSAIDSGCPEK